MATESTAQKRPRSPTAADHPLPPPKVQRTHGNQLQINYLARQHKETIPLVTVNEKLPEILRLVGEYDGVLQRHESIAGNLGACPLGPILLKRFDRLFDGPPRILKSHGRDVNVSWLDVVEFANNKPEQFNLEKMRNGVRVCQFYTKQCRVEISEEDFVLIASGMPQKLIPPQPILEDEEKELGVMDLLERNLGQVIQLADQVSARARQLIHKMKNRRTAILARRDTEGVAPQAPPLPSTGSPHADANGSVARPVRSVETASPPMGFTAVNVRQSISEAPKSSGMTADDLFPSNAANVTYINGRSIKGASPTERAEIMKKFLSSGEREGGAPDANRRSSMGTSSRSQAMGQTVESRPRSGSFDYAGRPIEKPSGSLVAIPSTPAQLMPVIKSPFLERDDGGPFKSEMVSRMESMQRGERVIPPCDRCRRLHMDCLKNLTACMGCTKKHAKCSWKDVRPDELHEHERGSDHERDAHRREIPPDHSSPPRTIAEVTRQIEENSRPPTSLSASPEQPKADGPDTVMEGTAPEKEKEPTPTRADPPLATEALRPASPRPTTAPAPVQSPVQSAPPAPAPPAPAPVPAPAPATAPALAPTAAAASTTMQSKFDVKPPSFSQQLHDAAHRTSPPRYSQYSTYPPKDRPRMMEVDDNDEGDRLQALAAQVYRSASQSVKPQESGQA